MFTAKQKRKENIAEYILYLWQLEDLLRAYRFDLAAIEQQLVLPQQQLTEEQKEQTLYWYEDLINLLRSEGKEQHGHLDHTMHLIAELNDFHEQLLVLPVGKAYAEYFAKVKPEIDKLRQKLEKTDASDIEVCFRALYSVMLVRMKNRDTDNPYIQDVLETISPLIARLALLYKKVETGEIDLFEGVD